MFLVILILLDTWKPSLTQVSPKRTITKTMLTITCFKKQYITHNFTDVIHEKRKSKLGHSTSNDHLKYIHLKTPH